MKADERTRLLLEAKTLQDLLFRSRYDPQENSREVNLREHGERFLLTAEYTVPDFTRIFGKDTSHWDGNIDQAASKAAGVRFAWAKAMDGTVPSKYFKENKARAREVGLPEGPYNWLYPNGLLSCKLQADTLYNYLQPLPKSDLPLMVDWEWTRWNGQPANPNMTDLEIFVDQWLSRGNRKPVLYTAFGYSSLFGVMPKRLRDKFEGVCAASYGGTIPSMPLGWLEWILWQFTAHAEAARFSPNDANKLNLDLIYVRGAQTLEKLGGSPQPEPQPPPEPEDPMNGRIKAPTNMRSQANVSSFDLGDLEIGDLVTYVTKKLGGDGRIYCLLTSAKRNGQDVLTTAGKKVSDVTVWAYFENIEELAPTPTPAEDQPKKVTVEMKSGKVFVADQFTEQI